MTWRKSNGHTYTPRGLTALAGRRVAGNEAGAMKACRTHSTRLRESQMTTKVVEENFQERSVGRNESQHACATDALTALCTTVAASRHEDA